MKIKIVYGVDMRLWRHKFSADKPEKSDYESLLNYIMTTFEFTDRSQFRVTFKDEDDDQITMTSHAEFEDAFLCSQKAEKKSLKLYIIDLAQKRSKMRDEEKAESEVMDAEGTKNASNDSSQPSPDDINAFLSDELVIDLLSDLFVSVFEALEAANYELNFIECVEAVILSSDGKYQKITSNSIWPYFMKEILAKHAEKINHFVVPMIRMNGSLNAAMIKQWIPTILNMMKLKAQNPENADCAGFGWKRRRGRGCRGRRGRGWRHGRRGRGWKHHHGHHGAHGHHHGHHGHGHGHHAPPHHQWTAAPMPPFGMAQNPWFQATGFQASDPSAPTMDRQNGDDEIEQEAFEYTEELVAVMNMGFGDMQKIKVLLNKHKGNKQNVVQELCAAK